MTARSFDPSSIFDPVRVYPDKSPLYHQGDPARRIYRVNSGVVMTYRLFADSQRQISGFCTVGDFFGLSSTEEHNDSAVAVTCGGIQSLSVARIEQDPELRANLLAQSYHRVETAQTLLMTLNRKTSHEKVAAFLLMLADRRQAAKPDGEAYPDLEVRLPMSRLDIADYLGLSRETVSRRLTDLQTSGIIELTDIHTACIGAMDRLRRKAGAMA